MKERGNDWLRRVDRWAGIPLVAVIGLCRKLFRALRPAPEGAIGQKRIAVLCFGAIGDLLLATALLEALHKAEPDASIHVYVSKGNAQAVTLLPPYVTVHIFAVTRCVDIIRALRANPPHLLLDTSQWPRLGAVVSGLSGAGVTVGFSSKGQFRSAVYDRIVPHKNTVHEVENFLALAKAVYPGACGHPSVQFTKPAVLPEILAGVPLEKSVFLHMQPAGVQSYLKEWPIEKWAALAAVLGNNGYSVFFTGAPADVAKTHSAVQAAQAKAGQISVFSCAGELTLPELAYAFSGAAAVVSVNTGIMHLAALAGAPTVGLHGPTNPLRWGPYGRQVCALVAPHPQVAYLHLGFEYPQNAVWTLPQLEVATVLDALEGMGVQMHRVS